MYRNQLNYAILVFLTVLGMMLLVLASCGSFKGESQRGAFYMPTPGVDVDDTDVDDDEEVVVIVNVTVTATPTPTPTCRPHPRHHDRRICKKGDRRD